MKGKGETGWGGGSVLGVGWVMRGCCMGKRQLKKRVEEQTGRKHSGSSCFGATFKKITDPYRSLLCFVFFLFFFGKELEGTGRERKEQVKDGDPGWMVGRITIEGHSCQLEI